MSLSALQWLVSVVFAAAFFYATVTLTLKWQQKRQEEGDARLKAQIDGVGNKGREIERKQERRWKHQIADEVEGLLPSDKATRLANRIRQDAYRD